MRRCGWHGALLAAAPLVVLALLIGSCGGDDNPTASGDTTAPAVAILAVGTVTSTSVQLTWIAPGDDGVTGTAAQYDIRYSTSAITAANFALATAVTGAPTPAVAGISQSLTVSGLIPNMPYYFAMKTVDEVPNWSGLSNVVQATTAAGSGDMTPPTAVILAAGMVTTTSVQLTWTSPGDDGITGTAAQYNIRYSTSAITAANFALATAVTGAPIPTVAGTSQSVTVSGLVPNTPYYFALKTADEVPNWSSLSNVVQATTGAATGDMTPPAATTSLAAGAVTATSVQLNWTSPGDDGITGTAAQYDIRYSTSAITAANFELATTVTGAPTPAVAGTSQSVTVSGLIPNTPYYFAMKTADEVPNWSGLSNVVLATTEAGTGDTTPPAAVTDLDATPADSTDILLNWTAPGDDGSLGTAHTYDIRYSTANITTEANWTAATQVSGEPTPTAVSTTHSMHVTGLLPDTDYFFAMKTSDEVPNTSALSNVAAAHTPTGPTNPPAISAIDLPDSVCINSSDNYAQTAKLLADGQLQMAHGWSSLATTFFAQLDDANWHQTGDCWDYTYDIFTCSVDFHACETGSEYEYSMAYNGSCSGQNYSNWVVYRSRFNTSTRSGSFYMYAPSTTDIAVAWDWAEAADELSGSYTFTVPVQAKWVSTFQKTPCAGTSKMYQWDDAGSRWWLENDIAWNSDGTGFFNTFDDAGQLQETHVW